MREEEEAPPASSSMTPAQQATQAALGAIDQAEATMRAAAAAAAESPSGSPPSPRMLVGGKKKARHGIQQGSSGADPLAPILPPRHGSPVMAAVVSPSSSPSESPKRQRAPPQQRAPSAQHNAADHFLLQTGPQVAVIGPPRFTGPRPQPVAALRPGTAASIAQAMGGPALVPHLSPHLTSPLSAPASPLTPLPVMAPYAGSAYYAGSPHVAPYVGPPSPSVELQAAFTHAHVGAAPPQMQWRVARAPAPLPTRPSQLSQMTCAPHCAPSQATNEQATNEPTLEVPVEPDATLLVAAADDDTLGRSMRAPEDQEVEDDWFK